jgi:hypothetical protein
MKMLTLEEEEYQRAREKRDILHSERFSHGRYLLS